MMQKFSLFVVTGLSMLIFMGSSQAQSDQTAVLKPMQLAKMFALPEGKRVVVPVAKLMRVDEGVFELEIGKTIDLTDRKILLAIRPFGTRNACCEITLNGENARRPEPGLRINLKDLRSTSKFVEDKEICILDVVDIALPKGARGVATFRLHCI